MLRYLQVAGANRALAALTVLVVILLLRAGTGFVLIRAVPVWEAFDEPGHFSYAVTLATQGRLPRLDDQPPNPERIQPPLVYLLLAGFLRLSGSDVSDYRFPEQNPHFYFNAHQIAYALHPPDPTPDERRIAAALIASRAFFLLLTLPGVALTYRAARVLWPDDLLSSVAAAAIFALWPQFTFNGSMISNDGAITVLGAALTWRVLALHKRPTLRNGLIALALILIGLLIKLNALALVAGLLVAALLAGSPRLMAALGGLTAAALVGGIMLLQQLPAVLLPFFKADAAGETGLSALWKHIADPQTPDFVRRVFAHTLNTSLGNFGWGQFYFPDWVQPIYLVVLLIAVLGLALRLLRLDSPRPAGEVADGFNRRGVRAVPTRRDLLILLSLLIGLSATGLALALFYQLVYWLPGRYLLPGLSAFSLLFVSGLTAFNSPSRFRRARGITLPGLEVPRPAGEGFRVRAALSASTYLLLPTLLLALTTLNLTLPAYLSGFFVPLPASEIATEGEVPHYGPGEMAPGMQILGYRLLDQSAVPGGEIGLEVYWQADQPISQNYTVRIDVIGPDQRLYGLYETYPRGGVFPTSQWSPGVIFKDRYNIPLSADFPTPGQVILNLTVYDEVYRTQSDGGFKRTRVLDDLPIHIK